MGSHRAIIVNGVSFGVMTRLYGVSDESYGVIPSE